MKAEAVKALRYRRKAKSSSDLKNSLVHQCEKSLNKAVKTIKGFLLQKAARNLNELKSKVDQTSEIQLQIEKESERITNMKQIETAKVTGSIMESKILPRINKTEENKPDFSIPFMDRMMSHKKMVELLATLSTKIKHSYHQNSILQAAEAKKQKKSVSQAKGLLTERKISVNERTKGVFVESLQEDNMQIAKKGKSGRLSIQDLRSKGAKKDKMDLSMYMPTGDRQAYKENQQALDPVRRGRPGRESNRNAMKTARKSLPVKHSKSTLDDIKTGKNWQKEDGIHPSWAAKQQKKLTLPSGKISISASSTGKKIVFDD